MQDTPLTIHAGTTEIIRAEVTQDDGTGADLTAYNARARFGRTYGAKADLELTLGSGLSREAGAFVMTLTPQWTARLKSGVWQLDLLDAAEQVLRVYRGPMTVVPQILEAPHG